MMKNIFFKIILICTCFGTEILAAEKIEVAVTQPLIIVLPNLPVLLDQVVTIGNASPEERATIGRQVLFDSGSEARFTSGDLLHRIRSAVSRAGDFEAREFQFSAPESVNFETRNNEISQKQIEYRLTTAIATICHSCRIHSVDIRMPKAIPANWKTYDVKYDLSRVQKSNLLPIDLLDDQGGRVTRVYLQVDVGIEKNSLVAAKLIPRGEAITEKNTRAEWKVWDGFSRFVDPDETIGKIANQNFIEGAVILESQLTKERLVTYGQSIKIIYIANSFEISSTGTSLENGGRGDMVRVKTMDQKKDLVGLVTERGVVQIQ